MAQPRELYELLMSAPPDPWRQREGFSKDMTAFNVALFDPLTSRQQKAQALNQWLGTPAQPCLFGRHAAKQGMLSYCVLTEADVARGDDHVRAAIQSDRTAWKRDALDGGKHGFVIVVASRRLALAEPGVALQRLALRLCELYLSRTGLNEILHDELFLRTNLGPSPGVRKWKVGVNYFSSQGDGRWWHDHRVPGGMALSMNSVGHMARKLAEAAAGKNPALLGRLAALPPDQLVKWALPTAMKTIHVASRGRIPGTRLIPRSQADVRGEEEEQLRREALGPAGE